MMVLRSVSQLYGKDFWNLVVMQRGETISNSEKDEKIITMGQKIPIMWTVNDWEKCIFSVETYLFVQRYKSSVVRRAEGETR